MLFAVMTTGIVLATLLFSNSALKDKEDQKAKLKEQLSSFRRKRNN